MAQVRPALTVDVNAAQQSQRRGGPSKLAAQHAMASAQAPAPANGDRRNGTAIRPGDIIHEDDLNAQGGFSSDDEEHAQDAFESGQAGVQTSSAARGANTAEPAQHQHPEYGMDSQDFADSDSSGEEQYGQEHDDDVGSEEDEGPYDEDEEELSSSPSIPDENIDFNLVYALHNFVATVEGQATVNKGNSLTLLDDSNSYWWLVRVLRTQEVGYIPAENIETPYERLARLNKHRNVDLTSPTDDDHHQVPDKIITSYLVKQRSFGINGYSSHSGKLSALSRRNHGPTPARLAEMERNKRGVQFGMPTYLEHSGNEYSDDEEGEEEYDEEDMIDEEEYEEDGHSQEGEGIDEEAGQHDEAYDDGSVRRTDAAQSRSMQQRSGRADGMEPDDGMDWDARESERIQRAQEERTSARQAAEQRMTSTESAKAQQEQGQQQGQQQQHDQRQQQAQQEQNRATIAQVQQQAQQVIDGAASGATSQDGQQRGVAGVSGRAAQQQTQDRPADGSVAQAGSAGFLPSQVLASRERHSSDTSSVSTTVQGGRTSPDAKRDKRASQRKSRGEEENAELKQGKKRSGVFSGLFSRNKDRKERKSGHFSNSSVDSEANSRMSEDSNPRHSMTLGSGGAQATGIGKALQERDRMQQEAYQRQFLQEGGRSARPGSLIATPGSAPMLNVLRVFAGDDVDSSATFKTVLLNQTTTAGDLVRQAMQRFRLDNTGLGAQAYCLTVKLVEGDERMLNASERPLQVFDQLTEAFVASNHEVTSSTMPSVKRSSVGSISSIASNLSQNPAIARLESDFSDDHHVKFYLHRVGNVTDNSFNSQGSTSFANAANSPRGAAMQITGSSDSTNVQIGEDSVDGGQQNMRFPLRLLIFPSDLPDGIVFDPQTNALIPSKALSARGPSGSTPGEGVPQDYREKIMALPRNSTVAEVIEQGLERFGILDGVVEGGDDVEDRSRRRRSKTRIRYGLYVKVNDKERSLQPSSKVLDAFTVQPPLRASPTSRRGKRNSTDSAMLLSISDDLRVGDPVFILRQVQRHQRAHPNRPVSPTENVLATKQDERRQAELGSVAPTPSNRALEEVRSGADPSVLEQQGMSRQEIIAAQRAAARERRALVLGSQPNDENGVDVMLDDRSRLRSSKMLDTGHVRYSFIPVSGEEHDISAIVEDVLRNENNAVTNGLLAAPSRPTMLSARSGSAMTIEDYVSAPGSPISKSPLSLAEVHATIPGRTAAAFGSSSGDDALERLVRDSANDNAAVEDRIDQVLARLGSVPKGAQQSRDQRAQSPAGTTTPLSMLATVAAGASSAAAMSAANGYRTADAPRSIPVRNGSRITSPTPPVSSSVAASRSATKSPPLPPASVTDFGIAHLYAVSEAAARRKPLRRRSSKLTLQQQQQPPTAEEEDLNTSVAGLFPPQAPYIEDRRVKETYAPIGRHLNGLEDSLDRLLADALRLA